MSDPTLPVMLDDASKRNQYLQQITTFIVEKKQALGNYDYNNIPLPTEDIVGQIDRSVLGSRDPMDGINNNIEFIKQLHEVVIYLLDSLQAFISQNGSSLSMDSLAQLSKGIYSSTFDFMQFSDIEAAQASAKETGRPTNLQNSPDVQKRIHGIFIKNFNFNKLAEELGAADIKPLIDILNNAPKGLLKEDSEMLKELDDFKHSLAEAGSDKTPRVSIEILMAYFYAVKLLSDVGTSKLVSDLFSNIFFIFTYYLYSLGFALDIQGEP